MRRFIAMTLVFSFACAVTGYALPARAQTFDSAMFGGLHWRLVGPFRGGRAIAVTGVPGDPDTFYFGAVGGGIWQTQNAGRTWQPIFDAEHVASIGAIAVAPSDPRIIYVGSGEADMRSDIQQGNGMYKSTDAGKTWTHIGLDDTRQIGKVLVDPKDPDVVYVAALGHQYGPNEQRGVFKTIDGGKTWSKVLYKDPNTGAIDLAMDPSNPDVLYASLWQTRRPPWNTYPPSNGPGGGLYKSADAGKTWMQIAGHGFPAGIVGHIGLSVSAANPLRVYAIVDTNNYKTGGVYRSDDAGATWTFTDGEQRIWTRGWYFGGITADPKNADAVYVNNTSTYRSTDAGKTFTPIKGAPGGDDNHILWIDPADSNRMILGTDQGVQISVDGAKTWSSWYNQPTAQLYHLAADNRFPYWIFGAQQDSGAIAVASRSIHTGIGYRDWIPIDVGGESGTIAPDPLHPGLEFGSGGPSKEQVTTGWEQTTDPTLSRPDQVWRSTWTLPMVFSPFDPHVLYYSHQQIFRSSDGGASWHVISPDLTRPVNTVPANLDPYTASDNTGLTRRGVVYWIAPSPIRAHRIWAGTDDGRIWLTSDEGARWQNVTPPQLTPWSKVGIIDASHFDANAAYAAIDRHRLEDNRPYIYKTHDAGKHWTLITNGLPGNTWVNVVREDPERAGLLYAGTDLGIYVSFDDGANWQSLQLNLPPASVRDIVFRNGDVIAGTHGRSIWILDDAAPLRQLSERVARSRAALLKPETAILFQRGAGFGPGLHDEGTPIPPEEPQGENAPYGALIDYYVSNASTPVVLTIADANGKTVRRYASTDKPETIDYKHLDIPAYWFHPAQPLQATSGAHRWIWNLQEGDDQGPVVPPGRYTVTLSVDGRSYRSPLRVVNDPRVRVSDADLRAQYAFALQVQSLMQQVQAARTRAQKAGLKALAGTEPSATPDEGGAIPQDFQSLRYIGGALGALYGAVESAPSAPTPEFIRAFAVLRDKATAAMSKLRTASPVR
ncbi:MAG TPA: hypothetical protein VGZ02_08225 [Candidatus Baltobacteraceae bacterium]|jgi:photosystem II stability/assembly factor-like uncharacterized protein|nr:hypothetical protein [Candidatus Baltobacteraceae bacterium]